ncbi:MAG TPA: 50S ribosomal protein L24 [Nitrosopumilaceae archaeon]|nr:50S ribosomal protein L24 [Nitrosopumilaceae archaeon]
MKPTKVRNYQIYRATYARRSKQLGSHLSEDLRKKYGKRSIRITVGDTVKVVRGEYRGVDGKVSQISSQANSVAIEGIKKEKARGEKFDVFIPASNVLITGLNLDDHWRKSKLEGKKPKATPKETKPTETKAEAPEKEATKEEKPVEKPKKESKPMKKTEKQKEAKPEKNAKTKPAKKKKEAKE